MILVGGQIGRDALVGENFKKDPPTESLSLFGSPARGERERVAILVMQLCRTELDYFFFVVVDAASAAAANGLNIENALVNNSMFCLPISSNCVVT